MVSRFSFRARARTVDHLGREQIADGPTAVSELWKNAYDAYATEVALHLFPDDTHTVAITDDGHGMSLNDSVEKWLVLGTESKATKTRCRSSCGTGFRLACTRLSVAFLGPLLVWFSKRGDSLMAACMLDWRLFQNPYLTLEDVRIPVAEVGPNPDIGAILASLAEVLMENRACREDRKVQDEGSSKLKQRLVAAGKGVGHDDLRAVSGYER